MSIYQRRHVERTRIEHEPINRQVLSQQIEQHRDRVLDLDLRVDQLRTLLDVHLDDLKSAVLERDRQAAHLAWLVELADETKSATGVEPSLAAAFSRSLLAEGGANA